MSVSPARRDAAISFLRSRRAQSIPHARGSLLLHLEGTARILEEWGNCESLCVAGLCHATYGTERFHRALLGLSERPELEAVIGREAEALVYFYCACDVALLYRSVCAGAPRYRDRFTSSEWQPASGVLRAYMEITFANNLETARRDAGFRELARPYYDELFPRCRDYVTAPAFDAYLAVYGHAAAS